MKDKNKAIQISEGTKDKFDQIKARIFLNKGKKLSAEELLNELMENYENNEQPKK